MPDKKPTDSEIVKDLKDKIEFENFDENGYAVVDIEKLKNILDLINRQKAELEKNENIIRLADKTIETQNAEIERLKGNGKLESENIILNALIEMKNDTINNLMKTVDALESQLKTAKAEAYKEFAERLNKEIDIRPTYSNKQNEYVCFLIDNLLKEMVGEDNTQ